MAVLPLLLQGKSGICKHTDFVEFISVSIISFIRTFISGHDFSLKQMFASAVSKFRKGRKKDFMRCKFVQIAYFVHEELYTSSLQNIIDNFFTLLFPQGEASPRRTAEGRETAFPFLICKGSLKSHDRIYLAADKHIICDFEGSLVESALALLAGYYVFMFNYPAGLTNFFLFLQKCILHIQDGKKLPASVISLVNSFHEYQSVLATSCASRSV